MMINNNNSQSKLISEMLNLLNKLGIPAQDCELAEKYLCGEAGDEVLDRFCRMDLTVPYNNLDRVGNDIIKKLNKNISTETGIRFMNVAFAIGRGSCASIFWSSVIDNVEEFALYKRMIICINRGLIGPVPFLKERSYEILINMAQGSTKRLKETIPSLKNEDEIYGAIGLAMYFGKKYEKPGEVTEEDEPLMAEYEDIILNCLDIWLAGHGCTMHEEIVKAVRGHQHAGALADRIDMCSLSTEEKRDFCFISSLTYLNFQLSELLTEVFRVCMAVNEEVTLCSTEKVRIGSRGMRTDIMFHGGDYDELFGMKNQVLYICWAANMGSNHILRKQLAKNTDSYLKALDINECEKMIYTIMRLWGHRAGTPAVTDAAAQAIEKLRDVLKSENPDLYRQTVQEIKPNHEQMIKHLVPDTPHAEIAREYLRGNCKASDLYPYDEEFSDGWTGGYSIPSALNKYQKHCNDKGFFDRCRVWLVVRHFDYMTSMVEGGCADKRRVKDFFEILEREQLDAAHQIWGYILLYKMQYSGSKTQLTVLEAAEEVFTKYLEKSREETIQAFSRSAAEGRYLGLRVLRKDAAKNKQEILSYTADGSKLVKQELLDILYLQKNWEKDIEALLDAKKAGLRELAVHVLSHWQQEGLDYNKVLLHAMEKEKNAKVMTLLQGALNIQENSSEDKTVKEFSKEDLIEQLHKGGRKRSIAWAYETPFSVVHKLNGEIADEQYMQAVLLCYALQDGYGLSKNAEILAENLVADELAVYVNELFDKWFESGADAKKRWVLYAASIHGGGEIIQKMYHQIQEWPQAARGAIAAEAVKALALSPVPRALLIVDGIARKFKFKQVKAAAGDALEFAASQLGISREELADRIVPNLGFDENMERIFDYGVRTFKVMLTPALEIVVYDENGKKLKNLPAPAKKDDEEKAAAAYEDFKNMKKEMKTVVSSQRARLEYALSVKREWGTEAWKALFVKNPLMHQFAIGLIWGIYENGRLTQSFRYMEDGSFNTEDEEEYTLPENAKIGLVHPVELSDESKAAWKQQLEDYEITQPVEQMERAVYVMTEEEEGRRSLERFGGFVLNDLSLNGKLTGLGWYRGSVQDAGGFYTYYREDTEIGMGVELHFSGSFVGMYGEDVTIYDVRFYKAGEVARGSYVYDEADKEKAYFLKDVPARYFSEIILQLTKATASSEERDDDWKKNVRLI